MDHKCTYIFTQYLSWCTYTHSYIHVSTRTYTHTHTQARLIVRVCVSLDVSQIENLKLDKFHRLCQRGLLFQFACHANYTKLNTIISHIRCHNHPLSIMPKCRGIYQFNLNLHPNQVTYDP